MKSLLGVKLGMAQWWNKDKVQEAVTLVDCSNLEVVGKRDEKKDGYDALVLGINKNKKDAKKKYIILKECNKGEVSESKVGDKIKPSILASGDIVNVTSISKGKGFQGVVKRHGFSGGPKSHGHRHALRSAGSVGSAFPQHVMKGKKMAGRMGGEQVTVKNLKIAWVDDEKNIVAVKGAVPGRKGSWVKIVNK